MSEFLYDLNSGLICVVLFFLILAATESGHRFGRSRRGRHDEGAKAQTTAIQAAMLGLLALLLGFTFTMALQRFDSRSEAVIDEANAIGTASLRIGLLPNEVQADARKLMRSYLDRRLEAGSIDVTRAEDRRRARAAEGRIQEQLWSVAVRASEIDPRPTTTALFIQALNELIDVHGKRDAALRKHVPEVVLLLLFAVFIIAGAILGYSGGLAGARPVAATVAMSLLIVLVIFIIIDLDRPRRGVIRVSQESMMDVGDLLSGP